jgi:hypothetical protein
VGKSQRRKGQRGEREAASAWRVVYPDARRGSQSRSGRDSADVEGTPWWLEVKTLARIAALRHLEQAEAATDGRPCVVRLRKDGDKRAAILLREELFLELLQRLGGAV